MKFKRGLCLLILFITFLANSVSGQDELEIVVDLRHSDWINSVAFSGSEGKIIASASKDNTIKLWNIATDKPILLRTLEGHAEGVTSVAFSPNGKMLASGSMDKTIKLWNTDTGKNLYTFKGHSAGVTSVAFNHDGTMLASGCADGSIGFWNPEEKKRMKRCYIPGKDKKDEEDNKNLHSDEITSVAFNHDGSILASGSKDETVKTWGIDKSKLWDEDKNEQPNIIYSFEFYEEDDKNDHKGAVTSVAFSHEIEYLASGKTIHNSKYLASGSADNTVKIWEIKTKRLKTEKPKITKPIRTLSGHTSWVTSVAFSPDNKTLASGSGDHTIRLWDFKTGRPFDGDHPLKGHSAEVTSVAFGLKGKLLISGSVDKTIRLWDASFAYEPKPGIKNVSYIINVVSFTPDGKYLALGCDDNTIRILDTKTDTDILYTLSGHDSGTTSLSFSSDGETMASGSNDGTIKLWVWDQHSQKFKLKANLSGHSSGVSSVVFDPDGKYLASGSADETIIIWELANNKLFRTLSGHTSGVTSLSFSPDGKTLASGSEDKTIRLWEVDKTRNVFERIWDFFSPDIFGEHLFGVTSVAFNPRNGKFLVSGGKGNTLKLWDTENRKEINTLKKHTGSITSVAFNHDGKILGSASADKTIMLWDTSNYENYEHIRTLTGHSSKVFSISFSPDYNHLASSGQDNTLKIWNISEERLLLTMVAFNDGGYFVNTPNGQYDYSLSPKQNKEHVNLMRGEEKVELEKLYPDLIKRVMSGKIYKTPVDGVKITVISPPHLHICSPDSDEVLSNEIKIKAEASDHTGKYEITACHIILNGEKITGEGDIKPYKEEDGNSYIIEYTVKDLMSGENKIEMFCVNSAIPNNKSNVDSVNVTYRKPRLFVLAVGVNEYKDKRLPKLKHAVKDAEEIIQWAEEQKIVGSSIYQDVTTRLIKDEDVTLDKLRGAGKFFDRAIEVDTVLIFFSGHGTLDRKDRYFFATNKTESEEDLESSGFLIGDLNRMLDDIKAQRVVLILDTCYSGNPVYNGLSKSSKDSLSSKKKIYAFSAGDVNEEVKENGDCKHGDSKCEHGNLSCAIINGLNGAANNIEFGDGEDNVVTINELSRYVSKELKTSIPPQPIPSADFPFAVIPKGSSAKLTKKLGTLIP